MVWCTIPAGAGELENRAARAAQGGALRRDDGGAPFVRRN
jgi:hypothetical protein